MEDSREAERRGEGRDSLSHTTMVTQGTDGEQGWKALGHTCMVDNHTSHFT